MSVEKLKQKIEAYSPYNEQEEKDREVILKFIDVPDAFFRSNKIAHMTASAWVINKAGNKALMCYHRIYNSWSWLGGHADGEVDLLAVALKEVKEESGLNRAEAVSEDIFSLEVLTVDGHIKKGEYVPSHLHLNVTFLICCDDNEMLSGCEAENAGVAWFDLDKAVEMSTEPWFREHIYTKLNNKLKNKG